MGFGNSNNWQTEAVLRNERLAKQTSLDKLLEHVNWDAETLTLSLNGITLSWGDIAGAGDVAMKSDIANVVRYTQIDGSSVITQSLEATNLTITGGSIQLASASSNTSFIILSAPTNNIEFSANGLSAKNTASDEAVMVFPNAIRLYNGTNFVAFACAGPETGTLNGKTILTEENGASVLGLSSYATINELSKYAKQQTAVEFTKAYITNPGAISEDHSILRYYESNGQICKTSSSRRWKRDIEDVKDEALDPHKLYEVPVRQFRYNEGTLVDGRDDVLRIGFIAEELDEIYPLATCHDKDGLASDWNDRALIPAMLKLIQELNERVKALENG